MLRERYVKTALLGFQEGLPRRLPQGTLAVRPRRCPKASPRPPKASPRPPRASPSPPRASPRAPQGVPKGSPKASPQAFKDFLEASKKPRKNKGFSMIFSSMMALSWPQVGPRWLMLVHAGLSWLRVGPSWSKLARIGPKRAPSWLQVGLMLPHVGPSGPQVGPKLVPSWPQVGPKLAHVGPSWSSLA